MPRIDILCIGEVLWDALPDGLFLGGAPFNVASHLQQLGFDCAVASRVGDDELGREIVRRLKSRSLSSAYIQTDRALATGFVIVELDEAGIPTFGIVHPGAWDNIEPSDELLNAARSCRAFIFGSLAQRDPASRKTIEELMSRAAVRVFDVNFRPPFVNRDVVEHGLENSEIVKLNDDELEGIARWYGFSSGYMQAAESLASRFGIRTLCVTRGAHGAILLHDGGVYEHPGCRVEVQDTVGSGDAFLASLVNSCLKDNLSDPVTALARANATGAFVASRRGATPQLDEQAIARLMAESRAVAHD